VNKKKEYYVYAVRGRKHGMDGEKKRGHRERVGGEVKMGCRCL
jgi:hypothetical protein